MKWFKNLNATPRLMLSFGILVAVIAGISYLSIVNLAKANDRIGVLYHDDMQGVIQANNIAKARLLIGRMGRDALMHIDDAAVVDSDEKGILSNFADIHANLDAAAATFYSPEGMEVLTTMKNTMPAFEQGWTTVLRQLRAKDIAGARSGIDALNDIGKPLTEASEHAVHIKEVRAGEKFQAGIAAYQSVRFELLGVSLAAMIFAVILSVFIARSFAAPLGLAVEVLGRVASGDLTAYLDVHTRDEVGRMAHALNEALEKLRTALRAVAESAATANSSSQELSSTSAAIATGAQQQAASLEETSASLGETSASLEETSASMEEITATVRQTADNARHANQLASGARESAETGQGVVSNAVAAMTEIDAASAKISDIIGTIDEIAFQTNLLAVNAAVEAARAGDEGRGFAVVATEVRTLAQRSATAAKEIKALIQDSLRKVERGTELVNKSGETLQGIVTSVKRVTDIVGEIAAAAGEQSTGVEQVNTALTQVSTAVGQVNTAMSQMDQVTQSNAAQTEELSATAETMSVQAQSLQDLVGAFKLGDSPRGQAAAARKPAPRLKTEERTPARGARSVTVAKISNPPRSESSGARRPVGVALATGSRSDEDNFEEF